VVEHEELGNGGMPDHVRGDTDSGSGHRIWLETVSLALDLLAWMPMLALTAETRRWEPKKLRLRLCLLDLFCSEARAQLVGVSMYDSVRFSTWVKSRSAMT
jgi:hypothetical protein